MSFQNKSIWMSQDYDSLAGEMGYDTSARNEQKRALQWSMDTYEKELFSNKKQAVEIARNRPTSGAVNMSMSLLGNSPRYGIQLVKSSSFADKDAFVFVNGDLSTGKKGFVDQVENDPSICLSMFRDVQVPLCLNTGVRKVKVNQAVLENHMSEFVRKSFNPGDKNKMISPVFHRTGNDMSLVPTYNTGDGSTRAVDPAFCKTQENFISVGQASNKRDGNVMLMGHHYNGNVMLMGHHYNGIDNNLLSTRQALNKRNCNFISIGEQCEKENGNLMSIGPNYFKGHENFIAMDDLYNKANEDFMSAGPLYDKGGIDITSMTSIHGQQDSTVSTLATLHNNGNSRIPMIQNHNYGKGTNITSGGFQDNPDESDPCGSLTSNHDVLLNQFSAQPTGALGQKGSVKFPSMTVVSASTSRTGSGPKNKEQKTTKKVPSNNFPSNVKSLLSTGILDGVPVKYVSWAREKNLRGVVNGTGYLCGCEECNLSNAVNAYEFERHAGCKTKHPNNHIYFENGKTIYAVVQELKSTSQNMLFEAIENVTGSPVNQKNFRTWKASYQAATRELQRIYGKDEVAVPS